MAIAPALPLHVHQREAMRTQWEAASASQQEDAHWEPNALVP